MLVVEHVDFGVKGTFLSLNYSYLLMVFPLADELLTYKTSLISIVSHMVSNRTSSKEFRSAILSRAIEIVTRCRKYPVISAALGIEALFPLLPLIN